ncbi:MAG TPA: Na+/H+ antiporter NhaA [Flavisolibacter sp.]|nr:Na+/H+ antiporter NhaA [Flavisolibacter sp.]
MKITQIFKGFFESEKTGGLILLACTLISLFIANSGSGEGYIHFWHSYLDLSFASISLNYSIEHWVNDGLMTIFFLLVGLEIERELYKGELADIRNAVLPIAAALGGMAVPALIHFAFNAGTASQSGFGIPMATDIAFTLGMLSLAGNRVPFSLKIFVTALAIIDDLGAILVIALFYSAGIGWGYLLSSLGIFALLMVLNKRGVKNLVFYTLPGIIMWYCMLKSGVHATITGVLLAIAIPFSRDDRTNPSYLLQHALHKPVAFIILPIFALANTGILLQSGWIRELGNSNSLGIMLGLVAGKPIGILLFCWLVIRFQWAKLPMLVTWRHLMGAGILAGIGFTMSIFISNLAFTDPGRVQYSKIAVLIASLCATILGLMVLFTLKPGKKE